MENEQSAGKTDEKKNNLVFWFWALLLVIAGLFMAYRFIYG